MSVKRELLVEMSSREWDRTFYTGVVKSLCKTITEPITNSDTSYKRSTGLGMDSGLVNKAFEFKKGTKFDLSQQKKSLTNQSPRREIEIRLYTAQGHDRDVRTFEIVDFAEGLTLPEVEKAFHEYAADKSDVSKFNPGRSLFGRGVSDVLFGHKSGVFASYKDGIFTKAEFGKNSKGKPCININSGDKPSNKELKEFHMVKGKNGTCVRVILHDDCRIPDEGTIIQLFSQFYMLRLINADPNVAIKVIRYRARKQILIDFLDYDFPIGNVLENFSFSINDPIPGVNLPSLEIQGIVCRTESKIGLPGREAGEQRANGLLIVDEKDAVLDQTLLPQFEYVTYLRGIFGIIRIKNIRSVIENFLNSGKESPLTVSREGFDIKNEFTKLLFDRLTQKLEPVFKHEEEIFHKGDEVTISTESKRRMNDVLKVLNKFLENTGEGDGQGTEDVLNISKPFQFLPQKTRLIIGKTRLAKLFFKKELAKKEGEILFDTENPKISITPLSFNIKDGKSFGDFLSFDVTIKCDDLHESGTIRALGEGVDKDHESHISIYDVISPPIISTPIEMEFRPDNSKGQPSRLNNLVLLVNSEIIPIGRKIKVYTEKVHGKIGLMDNGKLSEHIDIVFEKSHLIASTTVGRILVPWKGTGWGQWAKIIAETKKPNGEVSKAEARIDVEQIEENSGGLKEWRYRPLQDKKCSDLVDNKIYINSEHSLNNCVFGKNQIEFNTLTESDKTAQYRLSALVVEQAVFKKAEEMYINNKITVDEKSPVTSFRLTVDQLTDELAPKIVKILIKK